MSEGEEGFGHVAEGGLIGQGQVGDTRKRGGGGEIGVGAELAERARDIIRRPGQVRV